ncbi:ras-related protein Rab-5C-like [Saccoglossus kowalevskii]|uniref:Ras-related protein Rab-5C-like n=1 Tax=Saccoglossus kowalevskii TaxID=10224 RepID=A0ABM0MN29_SACKO|nr:PREDICTED: ras-related protein Rab-5C-like [Saccoglossus kowalevskii]
MGQVNWGDTIMNFDIWDTAGQERFRSILPLYYRQAAAAIVVYDVTQKNTFIRAKEYLRELRAHTSEHIVVALVANKEDLAHIRQVSFEEGEDYANENGFIFMETSAKTGKNINKTFLAIAKKLMEEEPSAEDYTSVNIGTDTLDVNRDKCCSH